MSLALLVKRRNGSFGQDGSVGSLMYRISLMKLNKVLFINININNNNIKNHDICTVTY